jgi:hypothetical protein
VVVGDAVGVIVGGGVIVGVLVIVGVRVVVGVAEAVAVWVGVAVGVGNAASTEAPRLAAPSNAIRPSSTTAAARE